MVHARISMLLDDILWVATLPQIRSAIAFYSHIMKLVNAAEKAAPPVSQMKILETMVTRRISQTLFRFLTCKYPIKNSVNLYLYGIIWWDSFQVPVPIPSKTPQLIPSPEPLHAAANSMFRRLDLDQTSYHLQVKKIDLHLCDDTQNTGSEILEKKLF